MKKENMWIRKDRIEELVVSIWCFILGTCFIIANFYFNKKTEVESSSPVYAILFGLIFYVISFLKLKKYINKKHAYNVNLKTINKLYNEEKAKDWFLYIIIFVFIVIFLFGVIIIIILGEHPLSVKAYIGVSIELIVIIGLSILLYKMISKRKKVDISINSITIEEDYIYDKDREVVTTFGDNDTLDYIYTKLNGKLYIPYYLKEVMQLGDIVYVVKDANNEVIVIYKKDMITLSNDLRKIIKKYDNDYIENKFNNEIESRISTLTKTKCEFCNKEYYYNEKNGICPNCLRYNKIKINDILSYKK